MTKTTNLHQGAHRARSRPAPAHPYPVGHADRAWSCPDTVRADAAVRTTGGGS